MATAFFHSFPIGHTNSANSTSEPERTDSTFAPERIRPHALAKLVRSDGTIDWSPWYLTEEEDMGQSGEQGRIIEIVHSSLQVLAEERGWSSRLVATDNFFAWVEGEPFVQVSPDIYLLDYPALADAGCDESARSIASRMFEKPLPRRWEPWRADHAPPRLAIEIVSQDWKKDYEINPDRYDHLGVRELVLADPEAVLRDLSSSGRAPLVIYRRTADDRLEQVYRGRGPAHCVEIDAYLVFQLTAAGAPRVRLSRDAEGTDLVPTTWEETAAERKKVASAEEKVAAQAAEIAAQAAEIESQAAKLAAQAEEIESLRARLRDGDAE